MKKSLLLVLSSVVLVVLSVGNLTFGKTYPVYPNVEDPTQTVTSTIRLYGKVLNADNQKAVSGVKIYSVVTSDKTSSNQKGEYSLVLPKEPKYQIVKFALSGYETYTARFRINNSTSEMSLYVYLKPIVQSDNDTSSEQETEINLYGRIYDYKTEKPLANVKVTNTFNNKVVYSDQSGKYSIELIEEELNKVIFEKTDYESYTAKVKTKEDIKLDVALQ